MDPVLHSFPIMDIGRDLTDKCRTWNSFIDNTEIFSDGYKKVDFVPPRPPPDIKKIPLVRGKDTRQN